ncbi:hypothetical protein SAMN05443669_10654 [Flavobacterium xanthum]|jgi:hypothetical protein|uniref:Uncharacterized protein n=1 Tax=Flavobacterium xanthum TaxID=69322 RepID=A0A1M7LAM2_9FLAO|nr:hypothetical protein SAMN05443669_10654 [Flavobacterium xanthum]
MLYFNILFFTFFNFLIFKSLSINWFNISRFKRIFIFIISIIIISKIYNHFFILTSLVSKQTYIMLLSLSLSIFLNFILLNFILYFFKYMMYLLELNFNLNYSLLKKNIPLVLFLLISLTQIIILIY